jgi:hypothetical protein
MLLVLVGCCCFVASFVATFVVDAQRCSRCCQFPDLIHDKTSTRIPFIPSKILCGFLRLNIQVILFIPSKTKICENLRIRNLFFICVNLWLKGFQIKNFHCNTLHRSCAKKSLSVQSNFIRGSPKVSQYANKNAFLALTTATHSASVQICTPTHAIFAPNAVLASCG